MPNWLGKGWGEEAVWGAGEGGRQVKQKMFSAASLGEGEERSSPFFLRKATQEENSSLRSCIL